MTLIADALREAVVGPPDMGHEAEQHQSDQEELVKQYVRYHDDAPFLDGERRLLYRIDSRWNYPLHEGTQPEALTTQQLGRGHGHW